MRFDTTSLAWIALDGAPAPRRPLGERHWMKAASSHLDCGSPRPECLYDVEPVVEDVTGDGLPDPIAVVACKTGNNSYSHQVEAFDGASDPAAPRSLGVLHPALPGVHVRTITSTGTRVKHRGAKAAPGDPTTHDDLEGAGPSRSDACRSPGLHRPPAPDVPTLTARRKRGPPPTRKWPHCSRPRERVQLRAADRDHRAVVLGVEAALAAELHAFAPAVLYEYHWTITCAEAGAGARVAAIAAAAMAVDTPSEIRLMAVFIGRSFRFTEPFRR